MLFLARYHVSLAVTAKRLALPLRVYANMPPKRTASVKASGSKRKAQERDTDTEEETQRTQESQSTASGSKPSLKRTKTEYVQNGQPKNRVLPVKISFEKRKEDALRIATWNVCGWAASQKKVRDSAKTMCRRRSGWLMICTGIQVLC